ICWIGRSPYNAENTRAGKRRCKPTMPRSTWSIAMSPRGAGPRSRSAIRHGIIPIPLNTLLPVEQFHYILQDSRAKALFVSAPFLKTAESAAAGVSTLQKLIVVGDAIAQHPDFAGLLNAESPAPAAETCAD